MPRGPVLVELFQSQGCSSCPPADANVNAIADTTNVIALSFAVTYWDQLGWKDTYAKPAFTQRQWDYANANRRSSVATPQVWINGTSTIIGHRADELATAIAAAHFGGPTLSLQPGKAIIGEAQPRVGGADIWWARFDPETRYVLTAGENVVGTPPPPFIPSPGLAISTELRHKSAKISGSCAALHFTRYHHISS